MRVIFNPLVILSSVNTAMVFYSRSISRDNNDGGGGGGGDSSDIDFIGL